MPHRTCAACGDPVSVLAEVCPSCGGDPDLRLLEVGGRSRRAPPTPAPARRGRGRWVPLVGAFVALWAVVAVLAGGGTEPEEEASPDRPGSTTSTAVERSSTSRRPATTEGTTVVPGAPLLGEPEGLGIVLVGERSSLLDLDTGSILPISGQVLAVAGDALLTSSSAGLVRQPLPGVEVEPTVLGDDAPDGVWAVDGGNDIWTWDYEAARARLLRPDGEVLLTHDLDRSAWAMGAMDDGLVVQAPGGTYLLGDGGGISHLSTGQPLAAGGAMVHVARCDERLRCGVEVVDSQGRVVAASAVAAGNLYSTAAAPDGRLAYQVFDDGRPSADVLVDGRVVAEAVEPYPQNLAWSPDGRWLVVLSRTAVTLIDTFVGTPPVTVDLPRESYESWVAFVVSLP